MNDKKIALVTGGNRGIGFQICKDLGKVGFHVILAARNEVKGLQAVEELRKNGASIDFIKLDVSDIESVKRASLKFKERYSNLDVLINNAGISIDRDDILQLKNEVFLETINTNAFGAFYVSQNFAQYLKEGGKIINMSSDLGSLNKMGGYAAAYSISKAMLNAITIQFASVLSARSISVNSVSPGWVKSDMGGSSAPRSLEEGASTVLWLANLKDNVPTGKFYKDKHEIPW